jgi:hypothetical protein
MDANPSGDERARQDGGHQDRQAWVRANFTQIFGTSAKDLESQGIDPRRYAAEHRDRIRQFAQSQRRMGIAVPDGRAKNARSNGIDTTQRGGRGYGYRRGGIGMRGGSAWIGILIALFALRFLLVDSFAGSHAAVFWVLGIGGILLVARVFLFSWLRNRRRSPRAGG